MSRSIERNATAILRILAQQPRESAGLSGEEIAELTGLDAGQINDAVAILVQSGLTEWLQVFGSWPYDFLRVTITPRGRYQYERWARGAFGDEMKVAQEMGTEPEDVAGRGTKAADEQSMEAADLAAPEGNASPPQSMTPASFVPPPVGSPFGFTDED